MNNKTLSPQALAVLDEYLNFHLGNAVISVPYFNNKTVRARANLRVYIGKGNPKDIMEEVSALLKKHHIDPKKIDGQTLKRFMVDNNIGIECSGFVYHVLFGENESRGLGDLGKKIDFINCKGFIGKIRSSLRPAENCDVLTFASDKNSHVVPIEDALPGDIITMVSNNNEMIRNHVLLINNVSTNTNGNITISYSHSLAYPPDGKYNTGVRQGQIVFPNSSVPITEALWQEEGDEQNVQDLINRAKNSSTEIRRLNWF